MTSHYTILPYCTSLYIIITVITVKKEPKINRYIEPSVY